MLSGVPSKRVDVPEARADLPAGPEFAGDAEGVAQHHAGDCAGDAVDEDAVVHEIQRSVCPLAEKAAFYVNRPTRSTQPLGFCRFRAEEPFSAAVRTPSAKAAAARAPVAE